MADLEIEAETSAAFGPSEGGSSTSSSVDLKKSIDNDARVVEKTTTCTAAAAVVDAGEISDDESSSSGGDDDDDEDIDANLYIPSKTLGVVGESARETIVNKTRPCAGSNGLSNGDASYFKENVAPSKTNDKPNITIEPYETKQQQQHSSSSSTCSRNYYFIDASSLHDDVDDLQPPANETTSSSPYGSLPWYNTSARTNDSTNEQQQQTVAAQQQPSTITNEDVSSSTKATITPIILNEDASVEKHKTITTTMTTTTTTTTTLNKESLAIEIKEADSGESGQISPCPDNTKMPGGTIQKLANELSSLGLKSNDTAPVAVAAAPTIPIRRDNTFELDSELSGERRLSSLSSRLQGSDYERLQGELVFKSSITQYSQHHLDVAVVPFPVVVDDVAVAAPLNVTDPSSPPAMLRCQSDKQLPTTHAYTDSTDTGTGGHSLGFEGPFSSLPVTVEKKSTITTISSRIINDSPIVSGGVSCEDFKQQIKQRLQSSGRKTESAPIVSGGAVDLPQKSPPRGGSAAHGRRSAATAAWVVDMSDCTSQATSARGNKNQSQGPPPPYQLHQPTLQQQQQQQQPNSFNSFRSGATGGTESGTTSGSSSLGYFVNFDNLSSASSAEQQQQRRKPSDAGSSCCEFYVDLASTTTTSDSKTATELGTTESGTSSQPSSSGPDSGRRNMFSMFIDINNDSRTTETTKPQTKPRLRGVAKSNSSSLISEQLKQATREEEEAASAAEAPKPKPRGGVFMFIESDSPVVRRRTMSSSRTQQAFKRHSWNSDKSGPEDESQLQAPNGNATQQQPQPQAQPNTNTSKAAPPPTTLRQHKRAQSLSVERGGDLRKALMSHKQLQQVAREGSEEDEASRRDTPPNSYVEQLPRELHERRRRKAVKDLEPELQKKCDSSTFDLISNGAASEADCRRRHNRRGDRSYSAGNSNLMTLDLLADTAESQQQQQPTAQQKAEANSSCFTTSNDSSIPDLVDPGTSDSSLPYNHHHHHNHHAEQRGEFNNNSTPDVTVPNLEADTDTLVSESNSSLQSSMGQSVQESTGGGTDSSISTTGEQPLYNRLGEDLLKMFIGEVDTDVTIDVGGRHIKAHKCILSSRCQYFAAMLSGGWVENAGNIISLQGYTYDVVHFALCHIYCGEICIPETLSIVELATLADLLCLEGLKECIGYTLKVQYCHNFHRPCNGCTVGVLECLPIAAAYGLDEVYRKSLRWITKHFVRVWSSKEFATFPKELMNKCYHQHIVHMSIENVLQTIMDCDQLLTILPNVRWAETVFLLASNLLDTSMKFLTDNFPSILSTDSFLNLDHEFTWNIGRLEKHLLAAAERLAPEQACKAYSKTHKMFKIENRFNWSPIFEDFMTKIRVQIEKCLIRDAARAARTNAWLKMDLELRRYIQEKACLVILPNTDSTSTRSMSSAKRSSRHSDFMKEPKEFKLLKCRSPPVQAGVDFRKVKMAISDYNDRTHKQAALLQTKKVINNNNSNNNHNHNHHKTPKTDPMQRKATTQSEKIMSESAASSRPRSWPNKPEIKSRYLEPRVRPTPSAAKEQQQQLLLTTSKRDQQQQFGIAPKQRQKIIISSSDSSRTSSPAMKRAAERKSMRLSSSQSKVPVRVEGKARSSDNLTSESSGGAAGRGQSNARKDHPATSKSCGITRPESPMLARSKNSSSNLQHEGGGRKPVPKARSAASNLGRAAAAAEVSTSQDSLTSATSTASRLTSKNSPILGKVQTKARLAATSSPPNSRRSVTSTKQRPARSLEAPTAASRNRAAAVASSYQGSLNLRKSLLDAAKAPEVVTTTRTTTTTTTVRQQSVRSDKRDESSPLTKRSVIGKTRQQQPIISRSSTAPTTRQKPKTEVRSPAMQPKSASRKTTTSVGPADSATGAAAATGGGGIGAPKFLSQSSRSGTFLKDEPTILNKSDMDKVAIDL
ncbi:hypothetical protein TKK_0005331 [Trichogramma kaykai]|uniref:BTB domain-containing protein n=1 Tax=Trichogramma kaykai TaxID=54128 RepID=A0ABD2XIA1_9HYME